MPWRLEAAVDSAARQLLIDAAAHHLGDVIEGQLQTGAQFADQLLLNRGEADRQASRGVRTVVDSRARLPTAYCRLAHTKFLGKHGYRKGACLNVAALLRGGRGVSVQSQLHTRGAP